MLIAIATPITANTYHLAESDSPPDERRLIASIATNRPPPIRIVASARAERSSARR
jgi:hypothetical protein